MTGLLIAALAGAVFAAFGAWAESGDDDLVNILAWKGIAREREATQP